MASNFLTRSRAKWRDRNYYVEGTESIIRVPGGITRRSDLFGFADLVAIDLSSPEEPWVFLQVTSRGHISTRLRKIQREENGKGQWAVPIKDIAQAVLASGDRIVIEGWDQPGGAGTRWRSKERELGLEDLE